MIYYNLLVTWQIIPGMDMCVVIQHFNSQISDSLKQKKNEDNSNRKFKHIDKSCKIVTSINFYLQWKKFISTSKSIFLTDIKFQKLSNLWLILADVWQKTTKFWKEIILQLKNKVAKKHIIIWSIQQII